MTRLWLLACLGLVLVADTPSQAGNPLWIDQPQAQPWLGALASAADRSQLPIALIAELVGTESGFQTIHNRNSSAFGCGQQTNGNPFIARYRLNRASCADSILAASLQLRDCYDRRGSLDGALRCYGTTAALNIAQRHRIEARMIAAARYEPPNAKPATIMAIDSHAPATELHSTSLTSAVRTVRSNAAPVLRPRVPSRSPA